MKKKFGITAAIFIVLGFGMIHGSSRERELFGIGLIGLGCIYLLYLLYSSNQKKNKNP